MNLVAERDTAGFLDGIGDPALRRLAARWETLRGRRHHPRASDLGPEDTAEVAPDLLYIAVERPAGHAPVFRYTHVGERLATRFGTGLVGRAVHELARDSAYFAHVRDSLAEALVGGVARGTSHQLMLDGGEIYAYEAVQLPLSEDGHTIDSFLVCCRLSPLPPLGLPA
jgi:hypothetical protein